MPEGDVVWRAAQRLHQALGGSTLLTSDFRVPRLANTDLSGHTVHDVSARGKHLLVHIESDLTLHTHLQMDGEWRLYQPDTRWRGPLSDIRIVLSTQAWRAVGYRLPVIELVATTCEHEIVGHLGPDLLGADWNEAEARRRLGGQPRREIGDALLDQRNLAGVGNLYKSEVLFLRGVCPWRPVGAVSDVTAMIRLVRRLLHANKERVGQITTGIARRGETTWVYGRAGRPCRRCGTRIEQHAQGPADQSRVTFWCPSCQPC